jgi:large subunit ribosomal protein L30
MSKIRVTQVRSMIGRPENQKRTLAALGLGKINRSIEIEVNPALIGMVRKVDHLVKVEEI